MEEARISGQRHFLTQNLCTFQFSTENEEGFYDHIVLCVCFISNRNQMIDIGNVGQQIVLPM